MVWNRGTAESRGYDHAWRKLRKTILKRDGYLCQCSDCKQAEVPEPATEVDHVVSKARWLKIHGGLDGVDHPSNLQSMNHDCHTRKTAAEMGLRLKAGCDVTGWPQGIDHPWNVR